MNKFDHETDIFETNCGWHVSNFVDLSQSPKVDICHVRRLISILNFCWFWNLNALLQ